MCDLCVVVVWLNCVEIVFEVVFLLRSFKLFGLYSIIVVPLHLD